jgi:hypothetical protein
MAYLEEITSSYQNVCNNSSLAPQQIKKSLQYENWINASDEITRQITKHKNYSKINANILFPLENASLNSITFPPEIKKTIKQCYHLCRIRIAAKEYDIGDLHSDDLLEFYQESINKRKPLIGIWVFVEQQCLESGNDLFNLINLLGLYHWYELSFETLYVMWKIDNLKCRKPNILDAGLAFYFQQQPKGETGKTRNLTTGELGIEEWISVENPTNPTPTKAIALQAKQQLNKDIFFKTNAKRIQKTK